MQRLAIDFRNYSAEVVTTTGRFWQEPIRMDALTDKQTRDEIIRKAVHGSLDEYVREILRVVQT